MQKTLLRASALAATLAALSWLAAFRALGNLYYLGILVPASALFCLLLAWLLYLRRDGFIRAPEQGTAGPQGSGTGLHLDPGLVPHEGEAPGGTARAGQGRGDSAGASRVLAVAAAELVLLSLVLYSFAGIGASYYK
jgi:hypothetical protein